MKPEERERINQIQHGNVPEGYVKTRSGITPTTWTPACLGDIYTERKESGNESLPLLTVSIHSGVSDGELDEDELPKKVKRIEDKSQYKRAATGDLVFNMMRAWQGAIGTVRTEGMVSPAYIVAKPNDKVYPLFMDYYMKTPRMIGMINRQSYGVTDFRKRLYWDSFAPILCVLPPVREQRKIAEILSTQDRAIELQARKIEELKRFKRGCLERMFPRKGQKVPEKRFPGFTDDWQQRKLGDVADIVGGGTPSTAISEYWDGDIDWYAPAEMADQFFVNSSQRKITTEGLNNSSAKMLPVGTVLFTSRAGIGKTAILAKEGSTNQGFQSIIPHKDELDSYFIFSRTDELKRYGETIGAGSTFVEVSGKQMANMTISIPTTMEEQRQIGTYFRSLDNLITLHQRKLEEMKKQKKALMQLLLTGIVRVL